MYKKIIAIALIILVLLLILSSNKFKLLNLTTITDSRMYSSFIAFNGEEYSEVELEEGQVVNIYTTMDIDKGELVFSVYDEDEKLIVSSEAEEDEISFVVEETGVYNFVFEADWASGEYNAFWIVK